MGHIHVLERYFEVVRLAIAKPSFLNYFLTRLSVVSLLNF